MEELPGPVVVEILSRLTDSRDLARCRVASKSLNAVSYEVPWLNMVCSMSRYLKSRSPETKHLVTPFKTVFADLVRRSNNLESVSVGVDRALGGVSFDDVEDESDDLYLTDFNFIRGWLPSVSHALKSFSISDFWVQSCWRRSEALSLISSTCHNLVKLVVRNAWLSVDGLCLMPTLRYLTLEFVRLDDEDLSRINACFPNLTQLNLIGVGGLKEPKINLLHLTTCHWSVSNAPLSLIISAPCLVDFNLKCIKPRLVVLEAPSLSNFNLSLENTDDLRLKNCANIQCLQLSVECPSLGFLCHVFRHCNTVKRLTLDLVGRMENVDVAEFGLDTLLNCFPNTTYLNLGPGAWHVMENSFSRGGLEDGIGMKMIKELVAHLVVHEMGVTLEFIFSVLDKCTKLSDVSLLIHRDVDSYGAGSLISACRSKFPRVRWRWGIWKEGIKDTWVSDGI
ncbi:F-box/LRR-repeat protein At4g29420 [Cajanus cajan]|uniref:F-box/LRR-repeat protein At4g29420 family n=1 Tax=Cajanus cajan TaxID=3821 RepID=A0A151TKE3_CAJCA|nr:F-box/LRR-repeat protein At4g29420 [Cajanus cajan]KYP67515.1 F-box/LRR-repeat protein At4g29420 family [Cajanus cajan]